MTSRPLEIQGRIQAAAFNIAAKANECCYRSDGYQEEIEQLAVKEFAWAISRIEALEAALTQIVIMPFDIHEAMMAIPGHEVLLGGQDLRVHASMRDIAHSALHPKPEGRG